MTKENPPAIDPRYDPAYQRGFSGAAAAHSRIRAVETPKPSVQPSAESWAPRATTGPDPIVAPARMSAAEPSAAEQAAPTPTTAPTPDVEVRGVVLRGNPWIATLWVVGVLLITAGFFGTWRSQSIYVGATPVDDMSEIVTMEVLDLLSPPLLLVGLLVIAGVLFLHAITWRSRRSDVEDD